MDEGVVVGVGAGAADCGATDSGFCAPALASENCSGVTTDSSLGALRLASADCARGASAASCSAARCWGGPLKAAGAPLDAAGTAGPLSHKRGANSRAANSATPAVPVAVIFQRESLAAGRDTSIPCRAPAVRCPVARCSVACCSAARRPAARMAARTASLGATFSVSLARR
jgi:hypothetical protein